MELNQDQILSAEDSLLFQKVEMHVRNRSPFAIVTPANYRHLERLTRMMKSVRGDKMDIGPLTSFWDSFCTGKIMACWGVAVAENTYNFAFREKDSGVEIFFYPPGVSADV